MAATERSLGARPRRRRRARRARPPARATERAVAAWRDRASPGRAPRRRCAPRRAASSNGGPGRAAATTCCAPRIRTPRASRSSPTRPGLRRRRARERRPWWSLGGCARPRRADESASDAEIGRAQLVWSNMALHLVADPPALFARWHALLEVEGVALFSCLGPGTLRELRALYAALRLAAADARLHRHARSRRHARRSRLRRPGARPGDAHPALEERRGAARRVAPARRQHRARIASRGCARRPGARRLVRRARARAPTPTAASASLRSRLRPRLQAGAAPRARGAPVAVSLDEMRAMVRRPRPSTLQGGTLKSFASSGPSAFDTTAVAVGSGATRHIDSSPGDDSRMSALSAQAFRGLVSPPAPLRFGAARSAADGSVQWLLRRNCSMTPGQLVAFYLSLCAWSFAIAGAFWLRGATLVLPFAGLELLGVGAALLIYARHATDRERMVPAPRPADRRVHARPPHRPGRVRTGLGPGRADPRRSLADRAFGRGQARRGRPLRAARAAPRRWPTNCAQRSGAAASSAIRERPTPSAPTTTSNN